MYFWLYKRSHGSWRVAVGSDTASVFDYQGCVGAFNVAVTNPATGTRFFSAGGPQGRVAMLLAL
jgi:hypothetical protein